jgi:hypothetical protein
MKYCTSLLVSAFTLIASVALAAQEPTPTPLGKTGRKLGGGNFGVLPMPTPTGGAPGPGSLAGAARKTQGSEVSSSQGPSRGVVITNESLRKSAPTPTGSSIKITGSAKPKPNSKASPTPIPGPVVNPEYRDASGRTESDWQRRARVARQRIELSDTGLSAAREDAKRLENDFYAWSDGNYRERVIRPAWDQAKEKLRLLETEAEAARAGLAELEEEARKSGTPPGWLR